MAFSAGAKLPDYCKIVRVAGPNGEVKELIFPKALDLDRPKRPRTTFSNDQLAELESEYQRNQYLVGAERSKLADRLGLTETQVKVWFQNRRTKSKRKPSDSDSPIDSQHSSPESSPIQSLQSQPAANDGKTMHSAPSYPVDDKQGKEEIKDLSCASQPQTINFGQYLNSDGQMNFGMMPTQPYQFGFGYPYGHFYPNHTSHHCSQQQQSLAFQ